MIQTQTFIDDLARVTRTRLVVSETLKGMATTLKAAESSGEHLSGKLSLERDIADLGKASDNLRLGVFRLLVLGDMKRGKSTFLNALLGENLLPGDVNPCTALLTVLRYGKEKKVRIEFNDQTPPEIIDFPSFKTRYTIDPAEAKQLEERRELAFPNISHAVVEYPLPLLEQGVEIVDSPGLNDTEARNELSLGYINNCHAILFVLSASQPCTLAERRYLENYIKGRGASVFFLINAWDRVKESLIDPEDEAELAAAEERLRQVFRINLAEYCLVDGQDVYDERVFEISSLNALRRRIKDKNASLDGTGFASFMAALSVFLTQERAIAELRQARTLARQAYQQVKEATQRRIPLLKESLEELETRYSNVAPEFEKLRGIRDAFKTEIETTRDRQAESIANSFRAYLMGLEATFEQDFLRYQPELSFGDILDTGKRSAFEAALRKAFEQYITDKLAAWTADAEKEMNAAFAELSQKAASYGASYEEVTQTISQKLTGRNFCADTSTTFEDDSPGWAKWAMGLVSLASGNFAGVALAGAGFDWKNILLNLVATTGVAVIVTAITGVFIGPVLLALVGLGIGALQANQARQKLVAAARKELAKHLPNVAREQWHTVYQAVKECFYKYEEEVLDRLDSDIAARQGELDNLIEQKKTRQIDQNAELERLQKLEQDMEQGLQSVESVYQSFLLEAA